MSEVTVTNLNDATIEKLKIRADRHGLSLEEEARSILEQVVTSESFDGIDAKAQAWQQVHQARQRHADQMFSDSVELLREDRHR